MRTLSLTAYAKVNLALDILGRRDDGYHTMRMVMQAVSLGDTVTVTETAGGFALLAVRRLDPPLRVFVPWWTVRDYILAGDRGSLPLGHQPRTLADAWEFGR